MERKHCPSHQPVQIVQMLSDFPSFSRQQELLLIYFLGELPFRLESVMVYLLLHTILFKVLKISPSRSSDSTFWCYRWGNRQQACLCRLMGLPFWSTCEDAPLDATLYSCPSFPPNSPLPANHLWHTGGQNGLPGGSQRLRWELKNIWTVMLFAIKLLWNVCLWDFLQGSRFSSRGQAHSLLLMIINNPLRDFSYNN